MTERNIGALTGSTSYTGSVDTTNIFDLYKFNINSPGSFQFSIDGLSGNADLSLLNSSGETLYSSINAGTEAERISADSLVVGDYTLQISGDIKYTLNIVPTSTQQSSDADTLTGATSDSSLPLNNAATSEKATANKDVITGTPVDDKTVTAETTSTTTDEPDKPVATDSETTLTSEPEKPVATTESAVETTTTDKPVVTDSEPTLTSEPEEPISTTDSATETTTEKPVPGTSETALTSEPEKSVATSESASEELPTSEETTTSAGEIAPDKPTDSAISTAEKPSETAATNNPNSTAAKTDAVAGETVATEEPKTGETLVAISPDASKPEDDTNTDTSNGEETEKENSNTTVATTETQKEPEPITEKKLISLFTSGVFTTDQTGLLSIDYKADGGKFQGELAFFSLDDLDNFEPGSEAFIKEVAARSLSNSVKGHVVINDATEGARLPGLLGEDNANEGVYLGVKSFAVTPGGKYGVMLVPNGSVKSVFDNPTVGGDQRPLFSMAMANPVEGFHFGQIADITGEGNTFVMEDMRLDAGSDRDYNDIIFQVRGATAKAALLDTVINPDKEWRKTDWGKALIAEAQPYITPELKPNVNAELSDSLDELEKDILNPSTSDQETPTTSAPATTDEDTTDATQVETTDQVDTKPTTPVVTTEKEVKDTGDNPEDLTEVETTDEVDAKPTPVVTIEEEVKDTGKTSGDLTQVETTDKIDTKPTNLEVTTEEGVKDTENNSDDSTQLETTDEVDAKPTPVVTTEEEVKNIENNLGDSTQVETTDKVETKPTAGTTITPTAGKDTVAESTAKLPVEKTPLPVATTEVKNPVTEAPATPILPAQSNVETEVAETTPTEKLETQPEELPGEIQVKVETKPENLPAGNQSKVETKPEVLPAVIQPKIETKPEVLPAENPVKEEAKPGVVTEVEKTETTKVVVAANPVESVKESQPTAAVESKETPAVVPPQAVPTMPIAGTNTALESQKKEIVTQTETGGVNDAAPKESLPISPTVEKPTEDNSTVTVTESVKDEVAPKNNDVNADWIARLESIKQRLSNLGSADVVVQNTIDRTLIARLETMTEKLREQTRSTPISDQTGALISRLEDMVVKVAPPAIAPVQFEFPQADRPLVGFITDTGLTVNNPAEEKSPLVAEEKPANSTNNPSPSANGVNNNPLQPVVRTQDNSSQWVESLIKFVDAAKVSKQPHAVVNININLTQTQPDGTVIPRSELTAAERSAIAYAYQNKVIVVVPAGDNPGTMSALGLLSKEVDNVVTVGAAQRFNNSVALSNAFKLADYSGSGNTLDILANGSSGSTSSTKVAAVEVTNAIAQVLAANPKLNYTQAIDAIKRTSTDLDRPNWDAKTGSGLLNVAAAVHLAKVTTPTLYTVKPGQRTITDLFISQHPNTKQLPGDPTHPTVKVPGIPQTNVDRGSNNLANATQLIPSATEDVIDQVSSVDPSDIYRVDSRYLNNAKFSVLSGDLSVSYLTTSGQLLATQPLSKGSHKLQLPANPPAEVIVKIDQRNADPATYVLSGFESTATEPFNIDLEYETPLSASQQAIMQAAAKSVAGLIGKGLPSAVVDGKIIDDINIKISTANIDGASGTQARTKIDFMRYGSMLPAQSLVQFDAADIAELERSGKLFSVVQHEFLHALGFGNLWEAKGLVDYAGTPLAQYNGAKAVDTFKDLGGLADAISLETEGKGSAGLHWNEALFQDEVMTADLNFSGKAGNAPISPVTIASLADLGYEVNLNGATPDFGLFGGGRFNAEDLTPEQIEAFRQLAEESVANQSGEFIPAIMPEIDPNKVAPEIWAYAEKFWKNGEYYDWREETIPSGATISQYVLDTMATNPSSDNRSALVKANDPAYWNFIANGNGFPNPNFIVAGNRIKLPVWHPNYEWKQEQERLRREEELRQRQEEEARIRREREEAFARDQERVRQEEEARRREAEAQQRELEDQQRRLREQMERRRQEEERRLEEARLAELARQAEIARQQGKGGLDWYLAKPMPEFGPIDPFETSLTGETVGNLVPDDYYRFTLSRGGRITAELRKLLADADLVLYDARNEPIAYSMREGITDEQIIADLIPGTYMLRVNSPKGATTDYELIVKFKHKLSQSEIGPPLGWKVGGNGNSGGGGASGPLFSDSRIQQIYDTALNNFARPERAKANAKIAELEREKRSYEQQMQELLDQMNEEQRQKVHQALDDARRNANVWVDGIANPIKGQVDNLADGILNKANSFANSLENTVNQVPDYGIGWVKDRKNDAKGLIRKGRDAVTSAVNSARSWLRGKLIEIQDGVNSAIQQFFDTIKNAYRTGAEINQIIANAAQTFRTKVDQAVRGANNLIGEFKGHVLSATDWTKNLGINVDQYGVKFNFNVYNNIIKPAVDGVADGFQSTISGIGSGLKGIIDWIEPRTQKTVADIVNAILGDKTGPLWNQINGVDGKIAATRTGVEKAIKDQGNLYKRLLDDFVNGLGSASNFVIGALMGEFNNDPSIWQVLLDSAIGMIPIAGEIGDVRDLIAYTKKFIDNPSEMQDAWNWVGVVGSLVGLIPVAGGAIKGVTKVARNADFVTEMRKLGPTIVDAVVDFAKRTDWNSLASKSKNFYLNILDTVEGFLRKLNDGIRSFDNLLPKLGILQPEYAGIGKLPDEGFFADLADNIYQLRRQAPKKIDDGFAFLKGKLDELGKSFEIIRKPGELSKNLDFANARIPGTQFKYPGVRADYEAHHLIPVDVANNSDLIRKSYELGVFDIDSSINGIFLPNSEDSAIKLFEKTGISLPQHRGSHPRFSQKIQEIVDQKWQDLGNQGKREDTQSVANAIENITNWISEGFVQGYIVNDPTIKWLDP